MKSIGNCSAPNSHLRVSGIQFVVLLCLKNLAVSSRHIQANLNNLIFSRVPKARKQTSVPVVVLVYSFFKISFNIILPSTPRFSK
jgi:hypothetical protein